MIPNQPSVLVEMRLLADLLRMPMERIMHVAAHKNQEIADAGTGTIDFKIPPEQCLLITHIYFDSYPIEPATNLPGFSSRQSGGFFDNTSIVPVINGRNVSWDTSDYLLTTGNCFLAFESGNLQLQIIVTPIGGGGTGKSRVSMRVNGYLLPDSAMVKLSKMATRHLP